MYQGKSRVGNLEAKGLSQLHTYSNLIRTAHWR